MNKKRADVHDLSRECKVYVSYLVDWIPDNYVLDKYQEANEISEVLRICDGKGLDRMLVAISASHRFLTRLVDVYTRVFYPNALVRRKWIVLLAILESTAASHQYFESPDQDGTAWFYFRMVAKGAEFMVLLGVSVVLVISLQIGSWIRSSFFKAGRC